MYEDYVAERIAQLRAQKNVSAREMSLAIGQNSSYINRIENRIAMPSMPCFFYICEYLGVTPREFFDDGNSYPGLVSTVVSNLLKLNSDDLKAVAAVVSALACKN